MRSLHVCFICNELPPATAGGIGPAVLTNARHLVALGHRVTVLGLYDRDYGWRHAGIDVRALRARGRARTAFGRAWSVLGERLRLRRALADLHGERRIDIVEWPDYEGLYLRPLPDIVDVVRNHGPLKSHRMYGLVPRIRHVEALETWTLRAIPNWIGVSRWFMDEWLRITGARPARTAVLYNPVDCDVFHPPAVPRRDDLILYSGSLLERKGVFALARAARRFLANLPHAKLMLVGREVPGHAGARDRIRAEVGAEHAERLVFRDPVPQAELAALMRECTLFAMPSILESFGNVWAEAMASGAPVVGSRLTCGPEVVPHEEAGLLADPASPDDVAAAVERLMRDPGLRDRFGARGRDIAVARYSTSTIMPRTVEFYRECLAARRPHGAHASSPHVPPSRAGFTWGPRVSVVVISYRRLDRLKLCVADLAAQVDAPPFEVVLVLQAYEPEAADEVRRVFGDAAPLVIVSLDRPAGVFGARNEGLRHARGEIIAFVDDDCRVPATWLGRLSRAYEERPDVGGVGGYVRHPAIDRFLHRAFCELWGLNPRRYVVDGAGFHHLPRYGFSSQPQEADWLSGGNMSFRREATEQVGFFDAIYGNYGFDDPDYSLRVRRAGWRLLVSPELTVDHFPSPSSRDAPAFRAHEEERHRVYFAYRAVGDRPFWRLRYALKLIWHLSVITQVAVLKRQWAVPLAAFRGALAGLREVGRRPDVTLRTSRGPAADAL
ncbi:MAG: glycosyltransferase [Gemmatimonadota bacterium]|nr:glycosyltransferase [Gemmatimonadota bacterium]